MSSTGVDTLDHRSRAGAAPASTPTEHGRSTRSRNLQPPANPLERVNHEVKRRVDVLQIFPNDDALLRLVTAVLFELHDEWIAFPRRYLPEGSMDQLYPA